jgi:hypothetical protein
MFMEKVKRLKISRALLDGSLVTKELLEATNKAGTHTTYLSLWRMKSQHNVISATTPTPITNCIISTPL